MSVTTPRDEPDSGQGLAGAIVVGAAIGTSCAAAILPAWLSSWQPTLLSSAPHAFWYLSRSAGVIAYIAFTLSIAMGLITTNRLARIWPGGPLAVDLHEFLALLGLTLSVFHALILLGDRWINYSIGQILVPLLGEYRPIWTALGQIGLWLVLPLTLSFYVRKYIGYRVWRTLHGMSFVIYVLLTLHGIGAGSDTGTQLMTAVYGSSILITVFLTIYRVLVTVVGSRPAQELVDTGHPRSDSPTTSFRLRSHFPR